MRPLIQPLVRPLVQPLVRRTGGPGLADQISDRIAARILDCEFQVGTKLPGQRELARRLQVDRRTVGLAYRRLAGRGLVEVRARSVAQVGAPAPAQHDSQARGSAAADCLFGALVEAYRDGISTPELVGAVEAWCAVIRERRVALKCLEPELAEHIRGELAAALPGVTFTGGDEPGTKPELGLPVVVVLGDVPDAIRAPDVADAPDECGGATNPGQLNFLASVPLVRLHLGLSRTARVALCGLRDGQVVAVISRSRAVRHLVRRAVSTLTESTLGFTAADPRDDEAVLRALALGELVLGEVQQTLTQRAGFRGRCLSLKLVAPFSIQAIQDRLGGRMEPCCATRQRL